MEPGLLTDLKITPTVSTVQEKTSYKIEFRTTNNFSDDGKIVLEMPKLIELGGIGASVSIQPLNRSIRAKFGKVIKGNKIEILNVFGRSSKKTSSKNIKIEFILKSARN
jgi:hypothetical protein